VVSTSYSLSCDYVIEIGFYTRNVCSCRQILRRVILHFLLSLCLVADRQLPPASRFWCEKQAKRKAILICITSQLLCPTISLLQSSKNTSLRHASSSLSDCVGLNAALTVALFQLLAL